MLRFIYTMSFWLMNGERIREGESEERLAKRQLQFSGKDKVVQIIIIHLQLYALVSIFFITYVFILSKFKTKKPTENMLLNL